MSSLSGWVWPAGIYVQAVPVNSHTELVVALQEGRAEEVLGTPEDLTLDFKRQPYDLINPAKKWELAKDVAGMANAQGGLIVLGIATATADNETREVAHELRPAPLDRFNVDGMRGVCKDWCAPAQYPSFTFFPDASGGAEGYLIIEVQALPEAERPALVSKMALDGKVQASAVGFPVRSGDVTDWRTADQVQGLLRDGLAHRRQYGRLTPAAAPHRSGTEQRRHLDEVLAEFEATMGWSDDPVMYWQSWVDPAPAMLAGLYSRDGVQGWLDAPEGLRAHGFSFQNPYVASRAVDGGLLKESSGGHAVMVRADGICIGGAVANLRLLARGQDGSPLILSPIVLTELSFEYFRLVDEVVSQAAPGTWVHRVALRRMAEKEVTLAPGDPQQRWLRGGDRPATGDELDRSFPSAGDAASDAANALAIAYGLFGLDVSDNPYIREGRVDIERFLARMKSY